MCHCTVFITPKVSSSMINQWARTQAIALLEPPSPLMSSHSSCLTPVTCSSAVRCRRHRTSQSVEFKPRASERWCQKWRRGRGHPSAESHPRENLEEPDCPAPYYSGRGKSVTLMDNSLESFLARYSELYGTTVKPLMSVSTARFAVSV